ncbi:MAG: hypothetical protein ABI639_07315 [Thermoanaerobaculia bacterium]
MFRNIAETKDGIDTLIDKTRDRVLDGTERAEAGVQSAAASVVEKAHETGYAVRERTNRAARRAHDGVERAAGSVESGVENARARFADVSERAANFTAEKPAQALLLAAGLGFLIGLVVRGRTREA